MAFIILTDTTGNRGYVALSAHGQLLDCIINTEPHDHASFLQPAIQNILSKNGISWPQVEAVAVSNGPGSYTGLRVGLASAKGLCFALGIPLITLPTLQLMAMASKAAISNTEKNDYLYCPMIDARRMEVFYALYNNAMTALVSATSVILQERWLPDTLSEITICFSGNGSYKLQNTMHGRMAIFAGEPFTEGCAALLAEDYFQQGNFADLAYTEPTYIKAFHSTAKPKT